MPSEKPDPARESRFRGERPQESGTPPDAHVVRQLAAWAAADVDATPETIGVAGAAIAACDRRASARRRLTDAQKDPRSSAIALDRLAEKEKTERAEQIEAVRQLIATAAAAREGRRFAGEDVQTLSEVMQLTTRKAQRHLDGLAICEKCVAVFRPKRTHAARCPACHVPSSAPPRYTSTPNELRGFTFTRGPAMNPLVMGFCQSCGTLMTGASSKLTTCSDACRKALGKETGKASLIDSDEAAEMRAFFAPETTAFIEHRVRLMALAILDGGPESPERSDPV